MVAVTRLANNEFKAHHAGYLRRALLAAVVLHFLLFAFSPPITFKPYRLPEEPAVVFIEDVRAITLPDPPKEVECPGVMPGPYEKYVEEKVEPDPPPPPDLPPAPPTPKPPTATVSFLAYEKLPVPIEFVQPEYPALAREAGIEGMVRMKVVVGKDGKVVSATVISSDVTPAMERAARKAALHSRFKPARQRNRAVEATVMIPYKFRLGR